MVSETFEAFYSAPEFASLPDNVTDLMLKLEDNFAKYSCISTFFWNFILGVIFSAIIGRKITPKTIFTDEDNTI
jgi:small basic protein